MKNNSDPRARVGQRRLEQIQKQAAGIQGAPGEDKDSAHTILILEEARTWFAQFYSETAGMSTDSSNALNSRWSEVRKQIWDGELDYLSREELEYGAKVAWRNSTRCVGRLVWASLVVRDLRHLNTPKQVFDALVDHIVLSTSSVPSGQRPLNLESS
jgi:nitric oxide synthase oxygenase domain/subunit